MFTSWISGEPSRSLVWVVFYLPACIRHVGSDAGEPGWMVVPWILLVLLKTGLTFSFSHAVTSVIIPVGVTARWDSQGPVTCLLLWCVGKVLTALESWAMGGWGVLAVVLESTGVCVKSWCVLYPEILVDSEALIELPVRTCKVLGLYKIHFFS